MARSEEEADYGNTSERADSETMCNDAEHDSDESDVYTNEDSYEESDDTEHVDRTVAADAGMTEADPYTYEESYEYTDDDHMTAADAAPDASSKRLARCSSQIHRRTGEGQQSDHTVADDAAPYATSKRIARPSYRFGDRRVVSDSARPKFVLRPNEKTQREDAKANRKDESHNNLIENLAEFLQYIVLTTCSHAREQSGPSVSPSEQSAPQLSPRAWATSSKLFSENAWKHTSFPSSSFLSMLVHNRNGVIDCLYTHDELKMHKKMWDCMKYDKSGKLKDNNFVPWCRKLDQLRRSYQEHERQANPNATEHRRADTATEHGECYRARRCTEWYHKWLAPDMLENETTPKQRANARYKLKAGRASSPLKSWMNAMLRMNLGNAKTAFFIFHHGIPKLLQSNSEQATEPESAELLAAFIKWHASLLISLVEHSKNGDAEYNGQVSKANSDARRHRIAESFFKVKGKTPGDRLTDAEQQLLTHLASSESGTVHAAAKPKPAAPFIGDMWSPE